MSNSLFLLPDVGEGLTEAEIVSWRVAVGETVAVNQVLVEIETAKSLVELPSPYEGVVTEILHAEGETVNVGMPIIRIVGSGATPSSDDPQTDVQPAQTAGSGAVLVGYGTAAEAEQPSRRRRFRSAQATHNSEPEAVVEHNIADRIAMPVIAKPPIRKLAKDLEVDLADVIPTGLIGDITRDDVLRHAAQVKVFHNIETPQWATEREERIPVKGTRKQIAKAMVASAFTAPHVSVFVDVDATRTMEFVKRLKNSPDFAGVKVSPLLIMAKAIIWAVRRNPTVNSAWTDQEIIVRNYVNLGVAAATPRGLIVPNVKEAQSMTLLELAAALEQLTLTAREGRTTPADMADGTITVTNIGVFGMDTGTPILNPGEVAIIALGTIKQKPWVVDGEVRPRFVTTLGASFDHRIVDGDVASRFLADVAAVVEEPALLLD